MSDQPTTAEEREELKRLDEAATPAPWTVQTYGSGQANVLMPRDRSFHFGTVYGAPGIATEAGGGLPCHGVKGSDLDGLTEDEYNRQRYHDGSFIAKARAALPRLIADVERLEKQIEAGRECAKVMLRLDELEKQAYRDVKPSECGLPVKIDITKFMHGIGGVTFALRNARMSGLIEGGG